MHPAGSGPAPRAVPLERATASALQRYLAARAGHDRGHLPALWLGRRGLTDRGIDQAIRHRGLLAGLLNLRRHQFRHTFVQGYVAAGGDGRDLMRLMGWKSRQLLGRRRSPSERIANIRRGSSRETGVRRGAIEASELSSEFAGQLCEARGYRAPRRADCTGGAFPVLRSSMPAATHTAKLICAAASADPVPSPYTQREGRAGRS